MSDLILYTMRIRGKPGTAAEICDEAIAHAQSHDWPKQHWAALNPSKVHGLLRAMLGKAQVSIAGRKPENGVQRPAWEPVGGYIKVPMPDPPVRTDVANEIERYSRPQLLTFFTVLTDLNEEHARQRRERMALIDQHDKQLERLWERAQRQLATAGIEP